MAVSLNYIIICFLRKGVTGMIIVRKMIESDIQSLHSSFARQGWVKPLDILNRYFTEQQSQLREVFVAEENGFPIGYATLMPNDKNGAFKDMNIPMISDFNVFIEHRQKGAGTAILDAIEKKASERSSRICLGVGLHSGYGAAQKMYIKRGYVPDGSGVWYKNEQLDQYASCCNDDDLILYLSKQL